jgi:hypothetical protein
MFGRLKSLFAAKPPLEFQHPKFGIIINDCGIWSGKVKHDSKVIQFYVGGTATKPDSELLKRIQGVADNFQEIENLALEFIRLESPALKDGKFTFYSLNFLWEDKPDIYAMEFSLEGDEDGIWRVEFSGKQPQSVGRDD